MSKFKITGGKTLAGEIAIKGAKNAALKAFAASLILDEPCTITNVPAIEDINRIVEIMKDLGVEVESEGNGTYRIANNKIQKTQLHPHLHQKLRASILLAGPILLQKGEVDFPYPGGCIIGKRPIDFFLHGFNSLGVDIQEHEEGYKLKVRELHGATVIFPRISVTGTEALMTFATKVPGKTVLINAAIEPEIPALADFLNACGAKISGAGTSTITIEGVSRLNGGSYATMPDRIEAGTFALLGLATRSNIKVTGIIPEHLHTLWALLEKSNAQFKVGEDYVETFPSPNLVGISKDIVTHEYPGLATDLQAPLTVLMTQAKGNSLIFETIYEGRLFYIDVLNSMGADILMCDPHRVLVSGPTQLYGRKIASPDIRAGIALVIAALLAKGASEIDNVYYIDRGYANIEQRLQTLGASIERIN